MSSRFDPLEAAKIGKKKVSATSVGQAPQAASAPSVPEEPQKPQAPVADMPPVVTPKPVPEPVLTHLAGRFRITKTTKFSWCGQLTYISKGQIIEAGTYGGLDGIERLVQAGVEMTPIEG